MKNWFFILREEDQVLLNVEWIMRYWMRQFWGIFQSILSGSCSGGVWESENINAKSPIEVFIHKTSQLSNSFNKLNKQKPNSLQHKNPLWLVLTIKEVKNWIIYSESWILNVLWKINWKKTQLKYHDFFL